jgi:hypothetical protein
MHAAPTAAGQGSLPAPTSDVVGLHDHLQLTGWQVSRHAQRNHHHLRSRLTPAAGAVTHLCPHLYGWRWGWGWA